MTLDRIGLYDPARESSACGVGFITRKDGTPSHDVIVRGDAALCAIPHRGGMSAEGVGDGAGVNVDLSAEFFGALVGEPLEPGRFGVGNFFLPDDVAQEDEARRVVTEAVEATGLEVLVVRPVPVDHGAAVPAAERLQLPILQWVFRAPEGWDRTRTDEAANQALLAIESEAYGRPELAGLYPLSLSTRTQTLKGRLNSNEVIPYFVDLLDERHSVRTLYFHTRFSTNTEPHPTMAQPFRLMAHNGELNTDRKNRLSDEALARAKDRTIVRPHGQSDSSRLDQTLQSRVFDDGLDLVEAIVALMPPAWENDATLPQHVRDMLEYFSLYEEKNDGPAAVIFSDGDVVGARLDRLGLRPLRTVETAEYLMVSSEAGQLHADPDEVLHRGRIEAGGMLTFDHRTGRQLRSREALELLAARRDYGALLAEARTPLDAIALDGLERGDDTLGYEGDLSRSGRYVSYSLNQESFRFLMDPMLATGGERISAMGYGNAIHALADQEGGMAKYFSQRFAQVTNPPLDSIREADGMTFRVALGAKPDGGASATHQLVVESPILSQLDMLRLREQTLTPSSASTSSTRRSWATPTPTRPRWSRRWMRWRMRWSPSRARPAASPWSPTAASTPSTRPCRCCSPSRRSTSASSRPACDCASRSWRRAVSCRARTTSRAPSASARAPCTASAPVCAPRSSSPRPPAPPASRPTPTGPSTGSARRRSSSWARRWAVWASAPSRATSAASSSSRTTSTPATPCSRAPSRTSTLPSAAWASPASPRRRPTGTPARARCRPTGRCRCWGSSRSAPRAPATASARPRCAASPS
ncbi:hypothetical protein GCM10025874_00930 [Arenivirga flava]|uniref:Glutamine amidotransferase type-2 domain-containing protein n=1 Tax=Arenivirga flava TaxID=1930060 RepID=A0AA37UH74_9MICO|nr:hypothetical protein GCM10025874_00930 [Arenivirga flava]